MIVQPVVFVGYMDNHKKAMYTVAYSIMSCCFSRAVL